MTRESALAVAAIALTAGLGLRLARLDVRPMHHDEANQAVKFGALLERGEYQYDTYDHHGPTLYYLTLPAAWLRGQFTLASLDERTLRAVPAVFGAATIVLVPLLSGGVGRTAAAAGAALMAVSPAMVFYSRMYIQESMFACFTLAFVIALGRSVTGPGLRWPALAGLAAGLAAATKETAVLVLPAALLACAIAWWSLGSDRPGRLLEAGRWRALGVGVGAAVAVAGLFYSSLLSDPAGILGPLQAAGPYVDRGLAPADHVQPWHYYLGLLTWSSSGGLRWSEAAILVLAAVGAVAAWTGPRSSVAAPPARRFWPRYLACNAAIATAIFSAIPYKTPWNLLPFLVGIIVLAGFGFSALADAARWRLLRAMLAAALVIASGQLARQAWRASVTYAADPRNPYVYAQTVPDAVRMASRIRDLAALHPDRERMLVAVIAPPHEQWPLPWYLRTMPHVGYWTEPDGALALEAPVVVASMAHAELLDSALSERYVSELFGLRPEVLMVLYIEHGLWDRFLARVKMEATD